MSNEVRIKITTDQKGAEKNVQSLNKSFGGLNTSLGSAAKKMAVVGTATAAAAGALGFITAKTFNFAANLELAEKKINIVFGDQASQVWDWADKVSARMGVTSGEAAELASKMGDLLIPMKFSRERSGWNVN